MKRIYLFLSLISMLLIAGKANGQSLVCNDLVFISLDENCSHVILPEEVLEGINWPNCIVELDKTAPFGNGPWVPGILGPADIGLTYQVRVKHLPSGNSCWGNVKAEDKLPPVLGCTGLSTVSLDAAGAATISPGDLSVLVDDACSAPADVTLSFAGNQSVLSFDCNDVGVQTIGLTATDESGNSASCSHTVLVTDPTNACMSCVSSCPPAVTVTFDEGYNNLLPAFEAGDWSVFDPYGNASFNQTDCDYQDSVYAVVFIPGTAGQSYFLRHWVWDPSSQTGSICTQPIIFQTTFTVNVSGKVFLDNIPNCVPDAGEPGLNQFSIVATKLPSGISQTVSPAPDGTYSLSIELSVQDSAVSIHLLQPAGFSTVCPSALSIPFASAATSFTFDIGVRNLADCPLMQGSLSALNSRRCQQNFFSVQYCNIGVDTAYNAYATVQLDPLMTLQSASMPYTAEPNNTYTFQLGNVLPFSCGNISMTVFISCDAQIGQTLCSSLTVGPNMPCDGSWTGPVVDATANCDGDSVSLAVWNKGSQDMDAPLNFIVIEDFIMYREDPFQLAAGDSITIKVPANGSTWRIEAEQVPDHPVPGLVSAAIEGCGGLTPGLINAFPQNDNAVFFDQECVGVTGSYDPNDKTAVPTGYDVTHIIEANGAIEYKIRFQNTGNDAAYRVVVVDTLPAELDFNTLESGASSHPYRLDIYPGGILQFVFDPIVLPDSNANEAASHGFVSFRIAQQPDLPLGTLIENTAAIYFDENVPVITNTAFHIIGLFDVLLESQTPFAPGVQVRLTPNPFSDQSVLEVQGKTLQQGLLTLYDVRGRLLRSLPVQGNRAVIERQGLEPGVYFFRVTEKGVGVVGGKVVVE